MGSLFPSHEFSACRKGSSIYIQHLFYNFISSSPKEIEISTPFSLALSATFLRSSSAFWSFVFILPYLIQHWVTGTWYFFQATKVFATLLLLNTLFLEYVQNNGRQFSNYRTIVPCRRVPWGRDCRVLLESYPPTSLLR